jgi:hypothetical protein
MAFLDCTTNVNYVENASVDEMAVRRERDVQLKIFFTLLQV